MPVLAVDAQAGPAPRRPLL